MKDIKVETRSQRLQVTGDGLQNKSKVLKGKKSSRSSKGSKMYLKVGRMIDCVLTPEEPIIGSRYIDVVINKGDQASKKDKNTMGLVRNKVVRTRARIVTDSDGNDHFISTVPRENSSNTKYNVLMRTKHGTLTEHEKSVSMHFRFLNNEVNIADTLEDEAGEMSDWLCEH